MDAIIGRPIHLIPIFSTFSLQQLFVFIVADAERCFRTAIEIARPRTMKLTRVARVAPAISVSIVGCCGASVSSAASASAAAVTEAGVSGYRRP